MDSIGEQGVRSTCPKAFSWPGWWLYDSTPAATKAASSFEAL